MVGARRLTRLPRAAPGAVPSLALSTDHTSLTCLRCGAALAYTPGDNADITCRFCGAVRPIGATPALPAQLASSYRELLEAQLAGAARSEVQAVACGGCGATTTRPGNVLSERCPFCDSPVVSGGTLRQRAPDGVLPFLLDEAAAGAAVTAWERALWFKPASLFGGPGGAALAPLRAVYLPYWSFAWDVTAEYQARRSSDRKEVTRGSVRTQVTGSTVLASATVPADLGADLEPWDIDRIVAPRDELLLGIHAETHGEGEGLARGALLSHRLMEREADHAALAAMNDPLGQIEARTFTYHAVSSRLLLFPVWGTSFRHAGQTFRVLVNGRTGEVVGERPVSRAAVVRAVVAPLVLPVVAAILAIALAAGHPLWVLLAALWSCLAAEGVLAFALSGGGDADPVRQGQYFLDRPGERGTESFSEMVGGALQGDARAQRAVGRGLAGGALLVGGAGLGGALLIRVDQWPVGVGFHLFAAASVYAFVYTYRRGVRQKRFLLGLADAP